MGRKIPFTGIDVPDLDIRSVLERPHVTALLVLSGIALQLVTMVPCSLFYDETIVASGFWWLFFLGVLLGGGLVAFLVCYDNQDNLVVMGTTGLLYVLLLAGWFFLASYSAAYLTVVANDVTPDTLLDIYKNEEVGLYKFQQGPDGGYVQSSPTSVYPKVPHSVLLRFAFACHGVYIEKTCYRESCDSNNRCHQESYDCSYWEYPDECPGYHMLTMAPLWATEAHTMGDPEHATPSAIVFQWRDYLLDTSENAYIKEHFAGKAPDVFKVEMCREDGMCALDIRVGPMRRHWNKMHEETGPVHVSEGVGKNQYEGHSSASDVVDHLKKHAPEVFGYLGKNFQEGVPVLWMPYECKQVFESMTDHLVFSEKAGTVATWLLSISLGVPAALSFGLLFLMAYAKVKGGSGGGTTRAAFMDIQSSREMSRPIASGAEDSDEEEGEEGEAGHAMCPVWGGGLRGASRGVSR